MLLPCSDFVLPPGIAAAYWAHSPVVVMTPEAGTLTKGHGGFQEVDQLPLFEVSRSSYCDIHSFHCSTVRVLL